MPAFTVIVEEPEPPVTGLGLNEKVSPAGPPAALRLTLPLNPLNALTLTV